MNGNGVAKIKVVRVVRGSYTFVVHNNGDSSESPAGPPRKIYDRYLEEKERLRGVPGVKIDLYELVETHGIILADSTKAPSVSIEYPHISLEELRMAAGRAR